MMAGPLEPADNRCLASVATAFHASGNPATLERSGCQFRNRGGAYWGWPRALCPTGMKHRAVPDYAVKLRTVHGCLKGPSRPAGMIARCSAFPVGTVITKTFYYPRSSGGFERVALEHDPDAHFERARA